MDFEIPADIKAYLGVLDAFIESDIKPLQAKDDNERFFDHRREHARTDWDNQGLPRHDWEDLLRQMRQLADKAGHLRFALYPRLSRAVAGQAWPAFSTSCDCSFLKLYGITT